MTSVPSFGAKILTPFFLRTWRGREQMLGGYPHWQVRIADLG